MQQESCWEGRNSGGYIVISMRTENFEKIIRDSGNGKNDVAFLDPYWRTIYDSGSLQTDQIRQELMSGHKLLGVYRAGELLIQPLGKWSVYCDGVSQCIFQGSSKFHVPRTDGDADHQCIAVCDRSIPCGAEYDETH